MAGIAPAVEAAYRWARAGRPGPVQVVMKANLFTAEEERVPRPPEFPQPGPLPRADERALDRAADMLRAAQRPVVYAGQGVVLAGCEREVQLLAARLGAPVVTSIKARGVLSERDPLCFGLYHFEGCEELLREADLCLALGTGFGQFATSYYKAPIPENLIQVDVDPQRLGRNYPAALGILADAREALQGLLKRLEDMGEAPLGEGHVRVRAGRRLYAERLAAFLARPQAPPFHGLFVMKTLREAFPPETIFLSDSSATQSWLMEQAF
ncbi:MAG: thiamine pyrophosphate-binding protein, partial [Candidatus Tectomicrobia bacterium]|nr:thiamine pyrophosphate-binding protein [Candidatus Tectomicrobia bacterium]